MGIAIYYRVPTWALRRLCAVGAVLVAASLTAAGRPDGGVRRQLADQPDFRARVLAQRPGHAAEEIARVAKFGRSFRLELSAGHHGETSFILLAQGKPPYWVSPEYKRYWPARCAAAWTPFAPWLDFERIASDAGLEILSVGGGTLFVDGHPCEIIDVNDSATHRQRFKLYAATDLKGLVVRVDVDPSVNVGTSGFQVPATYILSDISLDVAQKSVQIPRGCKPPSGVREDGPVCISVTSDRGGLPAGAKIKLHAEFTDIGAYRSYYRWTTTGGQIVGDGPDAELDTTGVAPGTFEVTVYIDDGCGHVVECGTGVTVADE